MSADGFVAGKDQSADNPLSVGSDLLHEWMQALAMWCQQAGLDAGVVNGSMTR